MHVFSVYFKENAQNAQVHKKWERNAPVNKKTKKARAWELKWMKTVMQQHQPVAKTDVNNNNKKDKDDDGNKAEDKNDNHEL